MALYLEQKGGAFHQIENAELLPAFYFIPKDLLDQFPQQLQEIPRSLDEVVHSWKALRAVENKLFLQAIIDGYAWLAWPYIGVKGYMEAYSGFDPAWIFAHSLKWVEVMTEEGVLPSVEELYEQGAREHMGFVSNEEFHLLFSKIVPMTLEKYHMDDVLEYVKRHRCFEDYDSRISHPRENFFRDWYHRRTRHPETSLEQWKNGFKWLDRGEKAYDPEREFTPRDVEDERIQVEEQVTAEIDVAAFMAALSEKDREILRLRMEGWTHQEIAERVGYKTHSAVLKRIRKIGEAYEKFSGEPLGFRQKAETPEKKSVA